MDDDQFALLRILVLLFATIMVLGFVARCSAKLVWGVDL